MGKEDKRKEAEGQQNCEGPLEADCVDLEFTPPPDGGFGWVVVFAAFCVQFLVLGVMNNFGVLFSELLVEFNRGKSKTSWVGSITYGLMFLSGPLSTSLCERLGCRPVAVLGGLIAALGTMLASFSTDIYKMYLTYGFLFGVGASMCYFPSVIILPQYFNVHLSMANGLVSCGSGVGTMVMGPVMQVMIDNYGWVNTVRFCSGFMLVVTFTSLAYRPRIPPIPAEIAKTRPLFDVSIFKNKAYIMFVVALSFFMLSYFVPFVHLGQMAIEYGVEKKKASLLVGFMSVSSTVGRLFFGKISDHPKVNRLYLYQLALLAMGISNTLCPLMNDYSGLIVYCVAFGFFEGCYVCQCAVLTGDIVGREKMAPGVGTLFGIKSVPLTLGPPIAGFLYEISNSYQVAFYVAGAVPTLAACLLFAIPFLMPPEEHEYWHRHDIDPKNEENGKALLACSSSSSSSSVHKYAPSRPPVTRNVPRIAVSPSVNSLHRFFDMPKRVSMAEIGSVSSLAIIPRERIEPNVSPDRASIV
eukprot:gene11334-12519_t